MRCGGTNPWILKLWPQGLYQEPTKNLTRVLYITMLQFEHMCSHYLSVKATS